MLRPLAKPPLRLALAQARVAPTPAFEDLATIGEVVDALPGWELLTRHAARETRVVVGKEGIHETAGAVETVSVLRAVGDDGMRAAISPTSVAVECDRYTEWARMRAAIANLFSACAAHVRGECERFGMRYVNEFEDARADGDAAGLQQLFNTALIAAPVELGRPLIGSLQELRLGEDAGELVIRHGLAGPGVYLLDLDRFTTQAQPFAAHTLAALADTFHRRIEEILLWAVHPDYLAELQSHA